MNRRILPINIIPKNSKIIIYGAGIVGRSYCEDNRELNWCTIVAAIDQNHNKILDFPVPIYGIEGIQSLDFDYILLARSSLSGDIELQQIKTTLIEQGIAENRVIYDVSTSIWSKQSEIDVDYSDDGADKIIKIAFHPGNPLGECVKNLKLLQIIAEIVNNVVIDVYSNNLEGVKAVYYQQKKLGKIYKGGINDTDNSKYDLVIKAEFEPIITYVKINKIERISPYFCNVIKALCKYQSDNYSDMPVGAYSSYIRIGRAKFWGENKYTMMSCNGILPIKDSKVNLFFNDDFKKEYDELGLNTKYITLTYGAGSSKGLGIQQTKVWPKEHFENLIVLIKRKYPDIVIVQVGDSSSSKLKGADKYILGHNLEIVKYVLRDTMFHVDSESGLVHLATQLGTKCFVLFGPTPIWFVGYEQNTNIKSQVCGECKGLVADWYFRCLNYNEPECMKSIKPEMVFDKIKEYLEEQDSN